MNKVIRTLGYALAVASALGLTGMASAQTSSGHKHAHNYSHDEKGSVYEGYFDDDQVKPRVLSDWKATGSPSTLIWSTEHWIR